MLTSTILLCTKNRTSEVRSFLDGVAAQTRRPTEVIVIDGAANPAVKAIVDSFSIPGLRYTTVDGDLTVGRNKGIREAAGDVVFFLDDDLLLAPDFVDEIMKVFEADANGSVGGVCGTIAGYSARWGVRRLINQLLFLPGDGNGRFRLSGAATWVYGEKTPRQVEFLPGGLTAYRRQVFARELFDEKLPRFGFTDDVDFSYRVSRRYKNFYAPSARAEHRRTDVESRAMDVWVLRTWIWAYWRTYWRNRRYQIWGYPALVLLSVGFLLRFVESNLRLRRRAEAVAA